MGNDSHKSEAHSSEFIHRAFVGFFTEQTFPLQKFDSHASPLVQEAPVAFLAAHAYVIVMSSWSQKPDTHASDDVHVVSPFDFLVVQEYEEYSQYSSALQS